MQDVALVLVPGWWEGPSCYDAVVKQMTAKGYHCTVAPLNSTGKASGLAEGAALPSLTEDIHAVQTVIRSVTDTGRKVLVAMHSAGGNVGSAAVEGLTAKDLTSQGKPGGVVALAFLTAAVMAVGQSHSTPPFVEVKGVEAWPKDPRNLLFSDMTDAEAEVQMAKLRCQNIHWTGDISYTGYQDVDSGYLICEKDQCLPISWQEKWAEMSGAKIVSRCDAGHCVTLSQPGTVCEFLERVVQELVK